ncbi:HNH endonuclease [Microbulbifer sp. JTAC008]|uniref:HNH endonuclease n=1 Tax=unclassified Microbulbifer TaxID=2619833 RepID=UPI004039E53F
MKLDVDGVLLALRAEAQKMGDFSPEFDIESIPDADFDLDLELERGKEISLDELDIDNGLLSVQGRQVLLYIPDHGYRVANALGDPSRGNKFHVADCSKLDEMKARNRFERYKVTNNLEGVFGIYGVDAIGGEVSGDAELNVCKLCLRFLNYQGYASGGVRKGEVFSNFTIEEFFSTYSSLFTHLPKHNKYLEGGGYSDDWKSISDKHRASANYTCQVCRVNLSDHKSLIHAHHINGNKRDNRPENLKVVCADCHKKEPHHEHMHVKYRDIQIIKQFRRNQGLDNVGNWEEVFALADTAVHGLLKHCQKAGRAVPEIGYEVSNQSHEVVAELEVAWPEEKKGIYINAEAAQNAKSLGWQIYSLGKAMKSFQ